jgi:hypothetical protein
MRLTLRNLLRFLDRNDIDPLERAQLEELVKNSDRATAWIQRIRSLTADPHRVAPDINGPPAACDVARYLDGTMSEQQAIEFETSMLASDQWLAEVASVHALIHPTTAAGSVEVPVVLRQTLYDIDRVFGMSADAIGGGGSGGAVGSPPTSMTDLPFVDVADSLGETADVSPESPPDRPTGQAGSGAAAALAKSKWSTSMRMWGLIAVVIVVLAGLTWLAYWLGSTTARQKMLSEQPVRSDEGGASDRLPAPAPEVDPGLTAPAADPSTGLTDELKRQGVKIPLQIADHPKPPQADGGPPPERNESTGPLPIRPDILWNPEQPVSPKPFIGPLQPPRLVARSPIRQPAVLFRSGTDDPWSVVDATTELFEGNRVLVLSGSDGSFQFGDGLALTVTGPALFSFGPFDRASGSDSIVLDHGRIQVQSDAGDVDWLLNVDEQLFRISMVVAHTVVEVEVHNYLPPGSDPRVKEPTRWRGFQVVEGRSQLERENNSWILVPGMALIQSQSEIPEWAIPEQLGVLDHHPAQPQFVARLRDIVGQESSRWIEESYDLPAGLIDLRNDPRQELRLAAMTWLAETGQFDSVIDYFGDEGNKSNWGTFLEVLRNSIQSRPDNATRLFDGLAWSGTEHQQQWYRLILGYGPDELEKGGDSTLVTTLNDDSLGLRALAIENLREITGGITYGYLPTRNPTDRKRTIRRQWEPLLIRGRIRYASLPAPDLPHVAPAAKAPETGENPEDGEPSEAGNDDRGERRP